VPNLVGDRPPLREAVVAEALVAQVLAEQPHPDDVRSSRVGSRSCRRCRPIRRQLRQLLRNLVDNAVHAASPRARCTSSARSTRTRS